MEYRAEKITDLQFSVTYEFEGKENTFTAVCAASEDELPGLVDHHVATMHGPKQPYVKTYSQLRIEEYPPMSDYLDGVVKGDQAQIDKYIADCLAVKAKYPKP